MSEPVAKQRPMINLDEFERRLRRPAQSQQRGDDPLAELARLVGTDQDPYQRVFQDGPQGRSQPQGMSQPRQQPELRATRSAPQSFAGGTGAANQKTYGDPTPSASRQGLYAERPAFAQPAPPVQRAQPATGTRAAQGLGGDFAAIEAGLRGSLQPDYYPAARESYAEQYQSDDPQMDDDDDWLDVAQASEPQNFAAGYAEPLRSRRLLYVTAAIIVVGISGIGATFALKRTPEAPRQIAMIKAATSPAKVRAPTPVQSASAKAAIQDASVLETTPQPPPVGIVNRTEEPVDLAHAAGTGVPAAPSGSAESVPVPAPPKVAEAPEPAHARSARSGVAGTQVASTSNKVFGLGGMIQPRVVKTVSVRPDGTIIPDDAAAPNPPDSTASAPAAPADAGQDASAAAAAPPQSSSGGEAAATLPIAAAPEPPAHHAEKPSHSAPVRVADLNNDADEAPADHAGSSYAVQLAARGTESEARHALQELAHKYGSVLGVRHLKFRRAKVNGKSVFRVRVVGLSKDSATKLCKKLEGKGGSCFVARD